MNPNPELEEYVRNAMKYLKKVASKAHELKAEGVEAKVEEAIRALDEAVRRGREEGLVEHRRDHDG